MSRTKFEVLTPSEIETIHQASMEVLNTVGMKCTFKKAQELFRQAGAIVDERSGQIKIPESLVHWAIEQAPKKFDLYGFDPNLHWKIGGGKPVFCGLGTPDKIIDIDTGKHRLVTNEDVLRHLLIVDGCQNIHCSTMDLLPSDGGVRSGLGMAVVSWARNAQKAFGTGCAGYLASLDMMRLMAMAVGGKEELIKHPRWFAICSLLSPLQMHKEQLEGLLIYADYGQPIAMSPEAIAGATAPVTLAGLLVQENAAILAHITLAQIYRPGTPVLYATVSTILNVRRGTVQLGAMETGLITAASVQLAKHYGLPIRTVGGTTESKIEDIQAGVERMGTLLPAVMAGADFITSAGTLDSTMIESEALMVIDDELAGMAIRLARGIDVNADTLALDLIRRIGFSGNYLAEDHTVENYRKEFFLSKLCITEPYPEWEKQGSKTMLDRANEKVRQIIRNHQPNPIDPAIDREMEAYLDLIAQRPEDMFEMYEQEELQEYGIYGHWE